MEKNDSIELSGQTSSGEATKSLSYNDFLSLLITNVANSSEKCDVWSHVLLDVIDNNIVNESVLAQVLTISINKSQSDLISNRVFSCKIFAKLCQRLDENVFIHRIYPIVKCLCEDSQPSVRANIAKQLSSMSINFSCQIIENRILPLIRALMADREVIVRIASIESFIDLIPKLDQNFNKAIVLPQMIQFFDTALESNDSSLGLIFMNFGNLCQKLPTDLIANEKWFLQYYTNIFLVSSDFQTKSKDIKLIERDIHCRKLLALFLPILLRIYGPNEELKSILNFLCSDIEISVQRTMATVFNRIHIHVNNAYKLYPQLTQLLSSTNISLAKQLMPFVSNILIDAINCVPNQNKDLLLEDIIKNLLICENTIHKSLDWRLEVNFFENLSKLMPYFSMDAIKTNFIPLLVNRTLTSRPVPVRIESSRCLIRLYNDIPDLLEDINIYEWFVTTLCYGKSCFQRMLFLNVSQLVYQLCDTNILINYFLEPLLSLCSDRVPNIRLKLCKLFKTFKCLLNTPKMLDSIAKIQQIFKEMLAKEKDMDVIDSIQQMVIELDWSSQFIDFTTNRLTNDLNSLNIECQTPTEINNNCNQLKVQLESHSDDSHLIELKSCLPQLIRSQTNSINSISKRLPTNRISNSIDSIPSKIPKPIPKASK